MSGSAIVGQPPANQDDFYIVRGLLFQSGLLDRFDPQQGFPIKPPPVLRHDTRGPSITVGLSIAIALTVAITGTRVIAKYVMKFSSLGWDDFLIVVAAGFVIVWFSLVYPMVTLGGAGKHAYNLTYKEMYWYKYYGASDSIIFYTASAFTKFSIIFFNARLTGLTSKTWLWIHRAFFVLIAFYLVSGIAFSATICSPYPAVESLIIVGKAAPNVHCTKDLRFAIALSCLHVIFDWMLLSIPIIVLFQMRMSWQKKLRCILPLSIGGVSGAGAAVRVYESLHPGPDPTYAFGPQMAWNVVDLLFAVTVTSLPAVYSMLTSHLPRIIRQRWTGKKDPGSPAFMTANGSHFPYDGNTGGDRSTNLITGRTHQNRLRRDHDLESLSTERDESLQEDGESFTRTNSEEVRIPEEIHHKS